MNKLIMYKLLDFKTSGFAYQRQEQAKALLSDLKGLLLPEEYDRLKSAHSDWVAGMGGKRIEEVCDDLHKKYASDQGEQKEKTFI